MKFLITTATLLFSLVSAQTGVPDVNSLAVQKHLRSRSALIAFEKRQRQGLYLCTLGNQQNRAEVLTCHRSLFPSKPLLCSPESGRRRGSYSPGGN